MAQEEATEEVTVVMAVLVVVVMVVAGNPAHCTTHTDHTGCL